MSGGSAIAARPLVSVIVSAARRGESLENAVRSVLRQTYLHYEIVLLDAGEPDGVPQNVVALLQKSLTADEPADAARRAASDHPPSRQFRVSARRHGLLGHGAALNHAIRHCQGDLIALLDANDEWQPQKLEKCVSRLEARLEEDLVYSHVEGDVSVVRPEIRAIETVPAGWMFDELFEGAMPLDSAVVFRRRVWERVGGFDETLPACVGYNFWLRASLGHRFGVIHEPLVVYGHDASNRDPQDALRELSTRARVLYECYELKGGVDRVDRRRAGRIIARAFRQAGWLALRQGQGTVAEVAFAIAAGYSPSLSARLWLLLGTAQRRWNRQPMYSVESDTLTFLR
jgi:glycosyltransferase involved in cell wall biosynthesis